MINLDAYASKGLTIMGNINRETRFSSGLGIPRNLPQKNEDIRSIS